MIIKEYVDLHGLISFEGFEFTDYREGERSILQPQLQALGYTVVVWAPGETDSFGPLTRTCVAKDINNEIVYFMYG